MQALYPMIVVVLYPASGQVETPYRKVLKLFLDDPQTLTSPGEYRPKRDWSRADDGVIKLCAVSCLAQQIEVWQAECQIILPREESPSCPMPGSHLPSSDLLPIDGRNGTLMASGAGRPALHPRSK